MISYSVHIEMLARLYFYSHVLWLPFDYYLDFPTLLNFYYQSSYTHTHTHIHPICLLFSFPKPKCKRKTNPIVDQFYSSLQWQYNLKRLKRFLMTIWCQKQIKIFTNKNAHTRQCLHSFNFFFLVLFFIHKIMWKKTFNKKSSSESWEKKLQSSNAPIVAMAWLPLVWFAQWTPL